MAKKHAPKGPIKARTDPLDGNSPLDTSYTPCTATSKQSGVRCKRRPIRGGAVCAMHGGKAPQVKAKALERLMALQDPAITRLAELIEQKEFPSTAMAAIKDALDRTMGKPSESVSMDVSGDLVIRHELPDE